MMHPAAADSFADERTCISRLPLWTKDQCSPGLSKYQVVRRRSVTATVGPHQLAGAPLRCEIPVISTIIMVFFSRQGFYV